jgi:hypothetical protein
MKNLVSHGIESLSEEILKAESMLHNPESEDEGTIHLNILKEFLRAGTFVPSEEREL